MGKPTASIDELLKSEVFCLGLLDYRLMVYTPYDLMNFLLVHGIIFSDELDTLNKIYCPNKLNFNKDQVFLEQFNNQCLELIELVADSKFKLISRY